MTPEEIAAQNKEEIKQSRIPFRTDNPDATFGVPVAEHQNYIQIELSDPQFAGMSDLAIEKEEKHE